MKNKLGIALLAAAAFVIFQAAYVAAKPGDTAATSITLSVDATESRASFFTRA